MPSIAMRMHPETQTKQVCTIRRTLIRNNKKKSSKTEFSVQISTGVLRRLCLQLFVSLYLIVLFRSDPGESIE